MRFRTAATPLSGFALGKSSTLNPSSYVRRLNATPLTQDIVQAGVVRNHRSRCPLTVFGQLWNSVRACRNVKDVQCCGETTLVREPSLGVMNDASVATLEVAYEWAQEPMRLDCACL